MFQLRLLLRNAFRQRIRAGLTLIGLVVAVSAYWIDVATMADLDDVCAAYAGKHKRRLRVATKYAQLTRQFFALNRISDYRIVPSAGATEGAPAAGGVLLDPAAIGRDLPQLLRKIRTPVLIVGADEQVTRTNNREYFFRFTPGGVAEVSVKDATHEDAQFPSGVSTTTEALQITFAGALAVAGRALVGLVRPLARSRRFAVRHAITFNVYRNLRMDHIALTQRGNLTLPASPPPAELLSASGTYQRTVNSYGQYLVAEIEYDLKADLGETRNLATAEPAKAKELLGWTPKVSFEELVRMMYESDLALETAKMEQGR